MPLPKGFTKAKINSKNPLVTVIIPVYNEEEDIVECLESLRRQTYKKMEVIVIDDGSNDKTVEILGKYKEVKLLRQKHMGPGEARNLGARKAKGEIIILIDADMVLFPDYIRKIIVPVIAGKTLGSIESIQYNVHKTKMQACWGKVVRTTQLEGENSGTVRAIAKKDFLNLGGFDRKYGYADDRTFHLKYGINFLIVKDVKCYHKTPHDFKGVYKQSKWIGASMDRGLLGSQFVRILAPYFMILVSPLAVPILAVKKTIEIKNWRIIFPWMIIFMIARYFGTIEGIFHRAYFNRNVR
ncbi:MAG: glycosyltransferase family 2 protein [archaeon]